jgi:hypothetical protein
VSWLIDTDVFSHPANEYRDARIVAWLKQEHAVSYTSTVVIAQLAYWVRTKRGRGSTTLQMISKKRSSQEAAEREAIVFRSFQRHGLDQATDLFRAISRLVLELR